MEKTKYQLLEIQQQKEFIQSIINLCINSERSYDVLLNTVVKEKQYCDENHIKLPKMFP